MKHSDQVSAELLRYAPLLYVAWADGTLGPAEIAQIRERTRADDRITPATRAELDRWLDPDAPPDASSLNGLLDAVRRHAARLAPEARRSLASLGVALGEAEGPGARLAADERAAIEELEAALGVVPEEAARALLPSRDGGPSAAAPPPFDPAALNQYVDRDHLDLRRRLLELLSTPEFAYVADTDEAAYRERVREWCARLLRAGYGVIAFPTEFGGEHDIGRSIAAFETIAFHDLSLLVKYGVQCGLFAGSIYQLGTRSHHERFLRAAAFMELPGCFAMTETGHGSNVRDLETTATYDVEHREFVIRTPHDAARKDYIGNAALHGRMATVFAQLQTGGAGHGVHAFLVPIRDDSGGALPGVRIEDCGRKEGLNGVDNGRLWFHDVRIPRDHLLDRFGHVAEDGTYSSPIASPARRFFTMLGTLVGGRVSIAAAASSAAKSGLTIAIRYADRRRQFGREGEREIPILDYLDVQRRLLPRLATTYALDFALKDLVRSYAESGGGAVRELEALAAGLKAYSARHTVETLQACRQACGGEGYMWVNRLPALMADTDVFTTFEGANAVLLQLVAKGLLTEYREEFEELRLWGAVKHVAGRAANAISALNPITTRRTDPDHLRDPEFHVAALRYREERLLVSLGRRLRQRIDEGMDSFDAMNACQDHALALAEAHIECWVLERFQQGVADCTDLRLGAVLGQLAALFGLSRIEADLGWFLEKGYIEAAKARAIRVQTNVMCSEIRSYAVALVDSFGIPDPVLAAPIALR